MSNSTIFSTVFDLLFLSFLALLLDSLHHTIGTVLAPMSAPWSLDVAPTSCRGEALVLFVLFGNPLDSLGLRGR